MTQIACSLNASDYRRRTGDVREISRRALRATVAVPGGRRLSFADAGDTRERLEELMAAESACCPFLTFDLQALDGELVLDVTGPADARPVIDEVFGG